MSVQDGDLMAQGYTDTIETVEQFLNDMKLILRKWNFSIDNDFYLLQDGKAGSTGYKNKMTMVALGYDRNDIYNTLISLTEFDYCETVPDLQYPSQPPLFVFSKAIDLKDVYIKVNVLDQNNKKVFVLSFHFAEHPVKKPYTKQEN